MNYLLMLFIWISQSHFLEHNHDNILCMRVLKDPHSQLKIVCFFPKSNCKNSKNNCVILCFKDRMLNLNLNFFLLTCIKPYKLNYISQDSNFLMKNSQLKGFRTLYLKASIRPWFFIILLLRGEGGNSVSRITTSWGCFFNIDMISLSISVKIKY